MSSSSYVLLSLTGDPGDGASTAGGSSCSEPWGDASNMAEVYQAAQTASKGLPATLAEFQE